MAIASNISKQSKLFSVKSFKLLISLPFGIIVLYKTWLKQSFPRLHSKSKSSSPSPTPLTPQNSTKEDELRKVFRYFDSDGDGKISSEELRTYFTSLGESMSQDEAKRVIGDFDINGDNLLEFQEFVQLMEQDSEANDDLKRAFEMFEVDKGSGCITPKGLQLMFNRLGDTKSHEECVAMIRVFDLDGNGVLDFHEFQQMMT
ncbi:hypothetical protein L1049_025777 [Liquidambar formosana]|uniref:EF-hand domain-containing protein n=1 Tax=Liquidambar formosana TaxID=63359 RepID=A0AAP0NDQ9_LIQFO